MIKFRDCLFVLLAVSSVSVSADVPARKDAAYWASALRNASLRDEAVCRLIASGEHVANTFDYREHVPDDGCKVRQLLDNTATPEGTLLVFLDHGDWDQDRKLRDGSLGGHFVMFDAAGRGVAVFEGANSLDASDGVIAYKGDQSLAVVHSISYGSVPGWEIEGLYVVPATTDQAPILGIMLAVPKDRKGKATRPKWQWRARDLDGDGTLEFEIGPEKKGALEPKAVYRYSPAAVRYEGPAGSVDGEFYQLSPLPRGKGTWELARAFVHAHGKEDGCDTPCSDKNDSTVASISEERDNLQRRFNAARDAGDYEQTDAVVQDIAASSYGRILSSFLEDVANYRIFERGKCDLGFKDSKPVEWYFKYKQVFAEGIEVCEAAKLPPQAQAEVRQRMARLLDSRAKSWSYRRTDVYDYFARQGTINEKALVLMEEYRLDDVRIERRGESALIEQIMAGRADNVRLLLDHGYDPNLGTPRIWVHHNPSPDIFTPFHPLPMLPLQAVRNSLPSQGEKALEVARVLLDHGANPNRLRWYPDYAADVQVEATLAARLDQLYSEAGKKHPAVSAEFRGVVHEFTPKGESVYARILVGNGSDKTVSIAAWVDGDDFLFDGLNSKTRLESRMAGGTQWAVPLSIEHGWSPATKVDIPPGQSREVYYEPGLFALLRSQEGMQYRLWINDYPAEIYTEPFQWLDQRYPVLTKSRDSSRDWYGDLDDRAEAADPSK